ncbi:YecA family protein [Aquabacterium sp. J223]|uniref:YecA/YgfB family protein n=1 Tax=Aquabacterium sp. J223 TaxID=2898431 RepID=UPI0021AD687A|nr:YecA family protein [Aquabacterium sp. J223]UUX96106.1 YecA family protein [Aquabacterium sp. J223]
MPATRPPAPRAVSAEQVEALLDRLPAPLEPLDVSAVDGYLCGVLLQPRPVPFARWWPGVLDADGRPAPAGLDDRALREAVQARHAALDRAIGQRDWFDPWVFELDEEASPSETVLPWVAGFAAAMDRFPALMDLDAPALTEPLALLYRHFDPDDLEDADALLAEIDTLEPPAEVADAVEDMVRATLLLADVSRPRPAAPPGPRGPRRGPPRR